MDDVSPSRRLTPFQEYQTQDPKQVRQIRTYPAPGSRAAGSLDPDHWPVPSMTWSESRLFRRSEHRCADRRSGQPSRHQSALPCRWQSLATVKVEARPGAWGGMQPKSATPEQDAERNEHYDAMLAASETAPAAEGGVLRERGRSPR